MMESKARFDWSGKLGLLVVGIGLVATGGAWLLRKPWSWPAIGLIILGLGACAWSEALGDWCKPHDTSFGAAFGTTFKHHGLLDCWELRRQWLN